MVPNGWVNTTIGKLGSDKKPAVKAGPFGSALKKEFYTESGYKIYGQEQVISNDPFYGNYYIDENKFNSLKSCAVSPGDILLSLVGTIGKVLLLPENCEKGIINPRLLRLSLDSKIVFNLFFKYFLEFDQTAKKLHRKAQGGTMGVINAESIKSLPILLPPIQEQQKIAEILSTWDKAIANTENLIANSEMQKKALMQQLLTGKKRLLDENGVRFSEEWEKIALKHLCSIQTGKKDANEGAEKGIYPFFTCAQKHIYSNNYSFDCEAILIAGNGVIGTTHYYIGKFEAYQRTYVLNNFNSICLPTFLLQFINYWFPIDINREQQKGAMPYIKIGLLQNFKVNIPPLVEQKKIMAVLSNADREIELLQAKLEHLKQEKKALMQQLLTGKRRVVIN
ncbi:MAG TPA: restriction endonuclease subunit S [Erysipelothrix sp.]